MCGVQLRPIDFGLPPHPVQTMSNANRRSKNITEGVARAPNRSMYYAMGYTEADFGKPMIGVANGHSTITPCNSGLQRLADAAVAALRRPVPTRRSSAPPPSATAWPWAPRA